MITVRAHNKKTGEITVMRVKRGTPMREVMASYASNKGVKAERLSWKRRSSEQPKVQLSWVWYRGMTHSKPGYSVKPCAFCTSVHS